MINIVVEGVSDTAAAERVVKSAGHLVGRVRVAGGKTRLDPKIPNYNLAARQEPWVVFRDSDSKCPVELRATLTANIRDWQPGFLLRIAHSMTEAWLLADKEGFADYFHVSLDRVPTTPEALPHAKQALLNLCSGSRSRDIREELIASDGGAGMLYVDHLNEFAAGRWDIEAAAANSESLRRAIARIHELPGPVSPAGHASS